MAARGADRALVLNASAAVRRGRTRLMDTRGDGAPIIRRECREPVGIPVIDDGKLRLVIPAAGSAGP